MMFSSSQHDHLKLQNIRTQIPTAPAAPVFASTQGRGFEDDQKHYIKKKPDGVLEDGKKEGRRGERKVCGRGHWRVGEDAKLKELVALFGPQNWNLIAKKLQGRSGKSCRLRWFNQLDPRINRRAFCEEEEEKLLVAHKIYGNKWALIARFFPGRTDNAVKNHWHVMMARREREESRQLPSQTVHENHKMIRRKEINKSNINEYPWSSDSSSSIINRDDESSPSTYCTNHAISLTSNTSTTTTTRRSMDGIFTTFSPPNHHKSSDVKVEAWGDVRYEKLLYEDYNSNSEASAAAESVDDNNNNNARKQLFEDYDGGRESISLPFIDFLGVGGT